MRFVFASLLSCFSAFAVAPVELLNSVPVRFEPHADHWTARGIGYTYSFTKQGTILGWGDRAVQLTFPGSNESARFEGIGREVRNTSYFVGNSYTSVPGYGRLLRKGIYPGVDVVFYGKGRKVEYDFEIAPGADPSPIRMRFDGADSVRLNGSGAIVLSLGKDELTQLAPAVYQRTPDGEIRSIESSYNFDHDGSVRLSLGKYDPAVALVVDPTFVYATYIEGTTGSDAALAVVHGAQGLVYVAGYTYSTDFDIVGNAYLTATITTTRAIWMQVYNLAASGGPAVIYSSYFGGTGGDFLKAMTVDANGVMYLTGVTMSVDFPTTSGAFTSTVPAVSSTATTATPHVFVAMFDPSQAGTAALIYSTYLAGSGTDDEGWGIAVAGGKIYVAGFTTSPDFPTAGSLSATSLTSTIGGSSAFAAEIDPTQSGTPSLVVSGFLGGSIQDGARAIALDAAGNVYLAGFSFSPDFPVTSNAYQPSANLDGDAFLAELNFNTGQVLYATYLGGSFIDEAKKIVIDPAGLVAMTGYTLSPDFPVTQNAFQTLFGGNGNAFLTILDITKAQQGLVYSSFYGGTGGEVAYDLKLDSAGNYYLCGYTMSPDLPVSPNALNATSAGGGVDGFIAVINPTAPPLSSNALVYGSYVTSDGFQIVYGLDVDPTGNIYGVGYTTAYIFPGGPAQNANTGKIDGFMMIFTLP